MVKLRLMRLGRKKRPFYRIVAADVNAPRSGGNLAQVGIYDPIEASVRIDEDAAVTWLNRGAQMTPTVKALFHSQGVLAAWKGLESRVREDALSKDKPKRRKKLATAPEPEANAAEASDATEESGGAEADAVSAAESDEGAASAAAPEAAEEK